MSFKFSNLTISQSIVRLIGLYTLLFVFISLQPVYAITLHCPQGALGSGGFYYPPRFKCFRGAVVPKINEYCEKGSLGSGGFYYPPRFKCFRGAVVPKINEYCEKGSLGSGGFYYPPRFKCFRGAVVDKRMMYCKQPGTGYRFEYPTNFQNASDCKNPYEGVVAISGKAFVIRGGKKIPLDKGFDIVEGDKIQTGPIGQVEFELSDGSKIRLSSNTSFTVDKYSYTNSCNTSNDFNICGRVYELLQGAFMFTSGMMDKYSEKNIKIKTGDLGFLGIRGTEFSMAHVINSVHGVNPGTYVKVYKGDVCLHNPVGSLDVYAGKAAYVANDKSRPIMINNPPDIFSK